MNDEKIRKPKLTVDSFISNLSDDFNSAVKFNKGLYSTRYSGIFVYGIEDIQMLSYISEKLLNSLRVEGLNYSVEFANKLPKNIELFDSKEFHKGYFTIDAGWFFNEGWITETNISDVLDMVSLEG